MVEINFEELGFQYIGKSSKIGNKKTKLKRFKSFYGATPKLINIIWKNLLNNGWFDFCSQKKGKTSTFADGTLFFEVLQY